MSFVQGVDAANLAIESTHSVVVANSGSWSQGADSPTIAQSSAGVLLAAWRGGARESDRGLWLSRFNDGQWSTPARITLGEESGKNLAVADPVLFQPAGGPLMLFYAAGPGGSGGKDSSGFWGMLKTSRDDGLTWAPARALGSDQRIPGGMLRAPPNPPIQLSDGSILLVSEHGSDRPAWHYAKSRDSGRSWAVTYVGPSAAALQPARPGFLRLGSGSLLALGTSQPGFEVAASTSPYNGGEWTAVAALPGLPPARRVFPLTLSDGTHLCVLESTGRRDGLRVMASQDSERWLDRLVLEPESGKSVHSLQAVQSSDGRLHCIFAQEECAADHAIRHVILKTEFPAMPVGMQATAINAYQIDLQWTAAKPAPVPALVERQRVPDGPWIEVGGAGVLSPVFKDVTVAPATDYRYRVRSYNEHGRSVYSVPVEAKTPPAGTKHGLIEIVASPDRPNEKPLTIDLTAEGTLDWFQAYEKKTSVRKAGGPPLIEFWSLSDFGKGNINGGRVPPIYSATRTSWSDGDPVASAKDEIVRWNGAFWRRGPYGIGYGFSVIADTTERIARIHCGRWGMKGMLSAWLSDGSVVPVEYHSPDVANMKIADTTFTIRYRAASAGQKLHFVWRHSGLPWDSDANMWVAAVTLAEAPPR